MLTHNGRIHELSDTSSLCENRQKGNDQEPIQSNSKSCAKQYDFICIFDVQSLFGVAKFCFLE